MSLFVFSYQTVFFFCLLFYCKKNFKKLSRIFEHLKSQKDKKLPVLWPDISFLQRKYVYHVSPLFFLYFEFRVFSMRMRIYRVFSMYRASMYSITSATRTRGDNSNLCKLEPDFHFLWFWSTSFYTIRPTPDNSKPR